MYNKKILSVRFVCMLFLPLLEHSEHSGIFYLHAWDPQQECYITSSAIIQINRNYGDLVVETRGAFYRFDGPTNIRYLDNIIRYLQDNKYTNQMFFEDCKNSIQTTKRGWRIY